LWADHAARRSIRKSYEVLLGKSEGKRSLGRRSHKWRIILKSILKENFELGYGLD
jgi:hypothetical protein